MSVHESCFDQSEGRPFVKAISLERTQESNLFRALIFGIHTDEIGSAFLYNIVEGSWEDLIGHLTYSSELDDVHLVRISSESEQGYLIGAGHRVVYPGDCGLLEIAETFMK